MKKRIISLLLALVMLFGVLPVTTLAESDDVVATSASKQGLGDKIKDAWNDFTDTLDDLFGGGNGGQGGGGGFNPGGGGPGDGGFNPGGDQGGNQYEVNDNWPVYWNQFYGFTSDGFMSQRSNETAGKFDIYLGDSATDTKWNYNTQHTVKDLYTNGITIVPKSGYYVKMILIGCGDNYGYNCNTARLHNVGRLSFDSTQSSTVVFPKENLKLDSEIDNNKVWHYGAGSPSYVMVWLGVSPNPATVTYNAGTMAGYISGNLVTYDKDASGEDPKGATVTDTYNDAQDTAEIKYQKDGGLAEGTQHLILDPNVKTVTAGGKAYQFTGWKIQYYNANNQLQDVSDSSGNTLLLYRDYVLTAQWKEVEAPKTGFVTITKVFTDGTKTLPKPENFTLKIDGKPLSSTDLTYTARLTVGEHTVTEESYAIDGYDFTSAVLKKDTETVTENSKTCTINVAANANDIYTLTNTYTKTPDPKASNVTKSLVIDDGSDTKGLPFTPDTDITFPTKENGEIQPILVEDGTVKLLYKITVTGDPKANFTVTDADTTHAYGTVIDKGNGVYEGTLPETAGQDGKASLEFYVVKTFRNVTDSGKLENSVTLDDKAPVPTPDDVPYYTPIELPLSVKKSMTGDTLPHAFNEAFTLYIEGAEKATGTNITATTAKITVSNKENVDFKVGEDALTSLGTVKDVGVYKYTLTEGTAPAHVTNNPRLPITLTYNVTLEKDESTGNYSLTYGNVRYSDSTTKSIYSSL